MVAFNGHIEMIVPFMSMR